MLLLKTEFDRSSHFHAKTKCHNEFFDSNGFCSNVVGRIYCGIFFSVLFILLFKFVACFLYGRFVSGLMDFI